MRFGFHFMDYNIPDGPTSYPGVLTATAKAAEEVGASWFTVMDHWFQMEQFRTAHDPMLEAYTTLGFLAGQTERVELGTIVTGVTYRHPGLLAKTISTLDALSGGRAFLGIGAAWYEREHLALGVPYPPIAERFERLEETLQIALQMWSDDESAYEGTHYRLAETINVPATVQRDRPPIVIGGSGEKKTLRLVAQYADATNLILGDPADLQHKLDVLRGHCDDLGRDYDSIRKTVMGPQGDPLDDPDGFLRIAEGYAALGVDLIHLRPRTPDPAASVRAFGERIAPRLAAI